jgi:hypothetical protein
VISARAVIELLGWFGAAMLIAAYALVSYGSVHGHRRLYQSLNVIAGILLAVNTAWHRAWPSAAVNVIWTAIAAGTLIPGVTRREMRSESMADQR